MHGASDMETHVAQIADLLRSPEGSGRRDAFVGSFVRPHGLDVPAAPLLVQAIEALGGSAGAHAPGFVPNTVQL